MLKNFFRKSRDERTINQLIFDIAEYNRAKDLELLYKLVKETEFFCSVDDESIKHIPGGEKYIVKADDKIKISLAKINGLDLILFYTSEADQRLGANYIKMDGIDALEMTLKAEGVSGLVIQNNQNSWCDFDKEKLNGFYPDKKGIIS